MTSRTTADHIDAIEDVLTHALALVRELDEVDADRPTDCPAWTVRDVFAHMVGLEQVLGGAPQPDIELPPLAHVVTDFDAFMERQVHVRRRLPLVAIADELAGLLPRRVAQLRAVVAEGDPVVAGPFGERPLSVSLPIRVFDLWAHEQDLRRAVGRDVRQDCPAAATSLERALLGWSAALPKLEGVDGVLAIQVTRPEPSESTVTVGAGGPAATLVGDLATLTWLFCGRGSPNAEQLVGDPALVAAVAPRLGLTP